MDPIYDIRELQCGGWDSSKIEVRSWGKWYNFSNPNSNSMINSSFPINYHKKYIPPQKPENITYNAHKNNIYDIKPQFSLDLNTREFKLPIDITPERLVLAEHEKAHKVKEMRNSKSQINSKKFHNKKTSLKKKFNEPGHVINIDQINIPKTPRLVRKALGDNPNRIPFRVSTMYITELSSLAESRNRRIQSKSELKVKVDHIHTKNIHNTNKTNEEFSHS